MKGPTEGYVNPPKNHYRRWVWNRLEATPALTSIPKRERVVVVLDESAAAETLFLIERGYSAANIIAVNKNPASAARCSGKVRSITGIKTFRAIGKPLYRALEELHLAGVNVHAVHADFCGPCDSPEVTELVHIAPFTAAHSVAVAVNVLRGRDGDIWKASFESRQRMPKDMFALCGDGLSAQDRARVRIVVSNTLASCGPTSQDGSQLVRCYAHWRDLQARTYVSTNNQSFLTMTGWLQSHGNDLREPLAIERLLDERMAYQETHPPCLYFSLRSSVRRLLSDLASHAKVTGTHFIEKQVYAPNLKERADSLIGPVVSRAAFARSEKHQQLWAARGRGWSCQPNA